MFLRIYNRLLDVLMDGRFDGAHEPRAHVDTARSESHRTGKTIPIREATTGDERYSQRLPRAREKDEVRNVRLADMAGALEPIDGQEVDAHLHAALRVSDGRALVQHDEAVVFEHLDDILDQAGGLDDLDAFIDDDLGVLLVWRRVDGRQDSQVAGEGLRSHGAAFSNLLPQVVWGWLGETGELWWSVSARQGVDSQKAVRCLKLQHWKQQMLAPRILPIACHPG